MAIASALWAASCQPEIVELGDNPDPVSPRDAAVGNDGSKDVADVRVDARDAALGNDEDSQEFANDCVGDWHPARGPQLEVLVLVDDSGSAWWTPAVSWDCLVQTCPPDPQSGLAPTVWAVAVAELTTFLQDSRSSGIAVALEYLGNDCDVAAHATLDVAFGELPEHAAAVEQSLDRRLEQALQDISQFVADTSTRPALEGALQAIRKRAEEPGYDARPIVLFLTDGFTSEMDCEDNATEDVSRVAAEGLNGTPSVSTYVFVTLPDFPLDEVAQAGGTGSAIRADLSMPGVLSAKLNEVREREFADLPCEYDLPPQYFEQVRDPERVNLVHHQTPLPRLSGAADCDRAGGGWYYDNASEPTQLVACSSTCTNIRTGGSLDIVLNCPTSGT